MSVHVVNGATPGNIPPAALPSLMEKRSDSDTAPDDLQSKRIQEAQAYFQGTIEKLSQESNPLILAMIPLEDIVNYQSTNSIFWVNEGKLELYLPKSPIGSYRHEDEVIKYIQEAIDTLVTAYTSVEDKDRWQFFQWAAPSVENGLNAIIKDYKVSVRSCYASFVKRLETIRDDFHQTVIANQDSLKVYVDELSVNQPDLSLHRLILSGATSFLLEEVVKRLNRDYGPRLSREVMDLCIPEIEASEENRRISRDELKDLLFSVASRVTKEDLLWKKEQLGLGCANSIQELPADEIEQLMAHFRKTDEGQSLLDFFEIPLDPETLGIANEYSERQPRSTNHEINRQIGLGVLSDFESVSIWDESRPFQMPELDMFIRLDTLFKNPYNANLFHTDRYISFLTVASTAIAYLQYCQNTNELEIVKANITPLVDLVESIHSHAPSMYKADYVEDYQKCWSSLIATLRASMTCLDYDYKPYYRSLFAYPTDDETQQQIALQTHLKVKASEYFARKIGYSLLEKGAFFAVPEQGKSVWYEVREIVYADGFVCKICAPVHRQDLPFLRVVFQGTIKEQASMARDKNIRGPGYNLWEEKGLGLISEALNRALKTELEKSPGEDIQVSVIACGHSLGGSDADNCGSFLLEAMKKQEVLALKQVDVHTFNAAGVPNDTLDRYRTYAEEGSYEIVHSLINGDIVENGGQGKGGKDLPPEHVRLIEAYGLGASYSIAKRHCVYAHGQTPDPVPHHVLEPTADADIRERYLTGAAQSCYELAARTRDIIRAVPVANLMFNGGKVALYHFIQPYATTLNTVRNVVNLARGQPTVKQGNLVAEAAKDAFDSLKQMWNGTQLLESS